MKNTIFVLFVFLFAGTLLAQPPERSEFLEFYGNEGFGIPGESSSDVTITAKIVPAAEPYGEAKPGTIPAWLVLEVKINKPWYLYSITQSDKGSKPSVLSVDDKNTIYSLSGPFFTDTTPKIEETEYFPVPLEEHSERVTWFAPLEVKGSKIPESWKLRGNLDGQICKPLEEGGMCVELNETFEAVPDLNFDMTPLIEASKKVPPKYAGYVPFGTAAVPPDAPPKELTSPPPVANSGGGAVLTLDKLQPEERTKITSLGWAILFGFLGGLILNVMPCVLPVIGLKILSFFEQAGKSRVRAFYLNASYSLGLLSVFLVLAFLSHGLSFMYSNVFFNITMLCVVFAMALSLMGLWEIQTPGFLGGGKSVELMSREGFFGAFFKGIITTLLAIPCSAPFLGPTVFWAETQITAGVMLNVYIVYACIGLGMASPYLLLGAFPELLRFLPKPGMWMETFKHIMGFALLIAVAWILSYIEFAYLMPSVLLLFAIWFCCWYIGRIPYGTPFSKRFKPWCISLAVFGITFIVAFGIPGNLLPQPFSGYNLRTMMQSRLETQIQREAGRQTSDAVAKLKTQLEKANENAIANLSDTGKHWSPYSYDKLSKPLAEGKIVIIDFTADWCLTCKAFEATVLHSDAVLEKIDALGAVSLQADITNKDNEDSDLLEKLGGGRSVPTVAVFDPKNPNKPRMQRGGGTRDEIIKMLDPEK